VNDTWTQNKMQGRIPWRDKKIHQVMLAETAEEFQRYSTFKDEPANR
jgi:hypothetical protein